MASALSTPAVPEISVEEYIARFVEGNEKPTCEYVDGELFPKSMGTMNHARVQRNLAHFLLVKYEDRYETLTELTTRLAERHFLVPDIAVIDLSHPIQGRYPSPNEPVFLCVEIMSPPDRFGKLAAKCEEYHAWGVPHCWIIDPETQTAWEYTPTDKEPRKQQTSLTAGVIELRFSDIFHGVKELI